MTACLGHRKAGHSTFFGVKCTRQLFTALPRDLVQQILLGKSSPEGFGWGKGSPW